MILSAQVPAEDNVIFLITGRHNWYYRLKKNFKQKLRRNVELPIFMQLIILTNGIQELSILKKKPVYASILHTMQVGLLNTHVATKCGVPTHQTQQLHWYIIVYSAYRQITVHSHVISTNFLKSITTVHGPVKEIRNLNSQDIRSCEL